MIIDRDSIPANACPPSSSQSSEFQPKLTLDPQLPRESGPLAPVRSKDGGLGRDVRRGLSVRGCLGRGGGAREEELLTVESLLPIWNLHREKKKKKVETLLSVGDPQHHKDTSKKKGTRNNQTLTHREPKIR